jgi:hypothetical protein
MMVLDRELQHKNTFIVIKDYDNNTYGIIFRWCYDNGYNDYVVTYCIHSGNTGCIKRKIKIK